MAKQTSRKKTNAAAMETKRQEADTPRGYGRGDRGANRGGPRGRGLPPPGVGVDTPRGYEGSLALGVKSWELGGRS